MVSTFFFFNTDDSFYVLINIAKYLSRRQTAKFTFQLVAPNI